MPGNLFQVLSALKANYYSTAVSACENPRKLISFIRAWFGSVWLCAVSSSRARAVISRAQIRLLCEEIVRATVVLLIGPAEYAPGVMVFAVKTFD